MNSTKHTHGIYARQFGNVEQANAYYLHLCEIFDNVQLLSAPLFGAGLYRWQCA
jgi:hypothetical protein